MQEKCPQCGATFGPDAGRTQCPECGALLETPPDIPELPEDALDEVLPPPSKDVSLSDLASYAVEPTETSGRQEDEAGFEPQRGRELSGLTETDLSLIGTYRVTKEELPHAQDVIWTDATRPRQKPASVVAREAEQKAQGIASKAPPPRRRSRRRKPAAPPSAQGSNAPRADAGADPFAALGDIDLEASSSARSEAPSAPTPSLDEELSSLLGGSAAQSSPRTTADSAGDFDAFSGSFEAPSEQRPPEAQLADAATELLKPEEQTQSEQDTFFIEAPSVARSPDELTQVGGSPPVPEQPVSSALESLFELDEASPGTAEPPVPPPPAGTGLDVPPPRGGGRSSKQLKRKSRAKVGAGVKFAAVAALLIVAGGFALGLTDLGFFGINALAPPASKRLQSAATSAMHQANPQASDTAKAYRDRIAALEERIGQAKPEERPAIERRLLWAYLKYANRFPSDYRANQTYQARVEALRKNVKVAEDPKLNALMLLVEGKVDQAEVAADQATAAAASKDPELLTLHGRVALASGKLDKAADYFQTAVEIAPNLLVARYYLGVVEERRKHFKEARNAYQKVLEKNPKHHSAQLGLARVALAQGDLATAEKLAAQVLGAAPGETNTEEQFEGHRILATVYAARDDLARRLQHLEAAYQLRPAHEETALELVELYGSKPEHQQKVAQVFKRCLDAGCSSKAFYEALVRFYLDVSPDEAERYVAEGLKKHPDDINLLFLKGRVAEERGKGASAREAYEAVVAKDPKFTEAYVRLAAMRLHMGQRAAAEDILRKGLEAVPDAYQLAEQLAQIYESSGDLPRARDTYKWLVERNPKNPQYRRHYAGLLDRLGLSDEAVRQFEILRQQGVASTEVMFEYVQALAHARKLTRAASVLKQVLRREPQNIDANVLMAAVQIDRGSLKDAEFYLETALQLSPDNPEAHYQRGRLAMKQNHPADAVRYFELAVKAVEKKGGDREDEYRFALAKALASTKRSDDVKRAISQLTTVIDGYREASRRGRPAGRPEVFMLRGQLYFKRGRFREALKDFEEALARDPSQLEALTAYATTLYRLNRLSEAENYFREVLKKAPNNSTAHYYLAQIALHRGDKRRAEEHLLAAVKGTGGSQYADAHKTLGYIYRERGLYAQARQQFELYLQAAAPGAPGREDVERELTRLRH